MVNREYEYEVIVITTIIICCVAPIVIGILSVILFGN